MPGEARIWVYGIHIIFVEGKSCDSALMIRSPSETQGRLDEIY